MTTRRTWLALALVLTVGAVLALYYWVHKPITPVQALALAQTLGNLAVALALVLLGAGLGRRLMRLWLGAQPDEAAPSPGEQAVLEVAFGWGILGLGLLVLGLLRLYYSWLAWLLAILLLIWLRREIAGWCAAFVGALRPLAPSGRLARLAAGFTGLMLALGFLRALAPPLMWDALVYHLTLPELYARTHGIQLRLADFSLFSGMPQLTEMLYSAAGLLRLDAAGGNIAAQALGWCFGALLCLGLAGSAQDMGVPPWLAPAILFSSLSVSLALAWAYADLLLMLLALAAILALRQWRRWRANPGQATRWLALAGAFAGMACGCKYTGGVVPLAGALVVSAVVLFDEPAGWQARLRLTGRPAAIFLLAAGVTFAPWLMKNWLLTGSPVYPLLWPAADMDALRQWFYNRPDRADHGLGAAIIFLRATFLGVQGGNDYDATLGPLFLICASALVVDWRWQRVELRRELAPLAVLVASAYLGWVLLVRYSALAQQARLFFAFLPPLALLGAAGLAGLRGLDTQALRISVVVSAAFALMLALSTIEAVESFVAQNPLPYLAGMQTAADYATAQLGWYQPAMERVNALPQGSRVVFLWEARSLACAAWIECVPDVVIDRWWHLRRTAGATERILNQWRAQGATHVLIYDTGVRFVQGSSPGDYDPADWTELEKLRSQLRPVATFDDAYSLYALP